MTEISATHAQITWQPPAENGGTPITGYHIERRLTSNARWITGYHIERSLTSSARWMKVNKDVVEELTFKVEELIEENEYEFRVMAENKVGVGPPSSPSKPVIANDPFSKYNTL